LIKFSAMALFFISPHPYFVNRTILSTLGVATFHLTSLLSRVRKVGEMKKEAATESQDPLRNPRNEVFLEGRVSSEPNEKLLPSGDLVVEFRIVIDRAKSRGKKREVDTLEIAVWAAKVRRRALALAVDDWVAIDGAVRRRFWRAPTGVASRWQVEASQLRRL
jgi:single-strand DNA-binding protein